MVFSAHYDNSDSDYDRDCDCDYGCDEDNSDCFDDDGNGEFFDIDPADFCKLQNSK
ncbi:hypothetical protein LOAG_17275 [Loa loa]|uniref:Fibrinogen C-terminal domain-containing protein n=1 Tax=Loa loa TaxID=7209 RepID=A0A1I7V604_LOALO|nr:hypothetical protein LOAG_17275 [Loa loa]EJD75616.1 hypothetical protein LOAG_17275 [Loa loa]